MTTPPRLPQKVNAHQLESIRVEYQPAYADYTGEGTYQLIPRVAQCIADGLARVAQITRDGEAALAKVRDELAHEARLKTKQVVATKVNDTLQRLGVRKEFTPAVLALLVEDHKFEVDKGYQDENIVIVNTPRGLHSVETVVERFLDSEEGAPYRPARVAPMDTYFARLMADLKRRR